MVECNIEFPGLQIGGIGRSSSRIDLEIFGFVFGDKVEKSPSKIGKEAIVLFLYRIREDVVSLQKVAVIDIERGQLVLSHGVYLLDIDEFSSRGIWGEAVRTWGGCKGDFLCESAYRL